jgi:uncharacterized protein YjbI with pentapeptide repeats
MKLPAVSGFRWARVSLRSGSLGGVLLFAGLLSGVPGLALVVLASSAKLVTIGAVLAGNAGTSLVGGLTVLVSERHSEQQRLEERERQREEQERSRGETSKALAATLQQTENHDGHSFVRSQLVDRAWIPGHSFVKAILDYSRWDGAEMDGADFTDASLIRVRFGWVGATNAKFVRAVLDGSRLNGMFVDADFSRASAGRVDFISAFLDGAKFTDGSPGSSAYLKGAIFKGSGKLDGTDFSGSDCREADFSKTKLYGTLFKRALLAEANFDGAKMIGVSFHGAMLSYREGLGAASFRDVEIGWMTDFSEAWLLGVDLSSAANLTKANLQGAIANERTKFPPEFQVEAAGVHMLVPGDAAQFERVVLRGWAQKHGKPAGWIR